MDLAIALDPELFAGPKDKNWASSKTMKQFIEQQRNLLEDPKRSARDYEMLYRPRDVESDQPTDYYDPNSGYYFKRQL